MRCGVGLEAAVLLALAFFAAAGEGWRWEQRLVIHPRDGVLLYAGSSEDETHPSNGATQRLQRLPGALASVYKFKNFNRDVLTVDFSLTDGAYCKYESAFGYYKKDLAAIDEWLKNARDGAYKYALKTHKTQAQLDAAMASLDKQREEKVKEYIASRGFKILPGHVLTVDVPAIVQRSRPVLNPVAGALQKVADQQNYDSESVIGAGLSLVQTAVIYKIPPDIEPDGRHTGGILQPATTLLKGWGDCDTKTALLSSILVNWPNMRIVGVSVPGHYLMGVLRIPNKGDAYIEYQGLQYVLVEPAGPAWLPVGQVAYTTQPLLEASEGFRIDPMF